MGIKAGSGRGSADRSGGKFGDIPGVGSSKRRDKKPIGPNQPQGPKRPVENTFPEDNGFRLGQYRIVEERADYVICTGYDPNAKNPAAEITKDAFRTIKVAKPPILQQAPWPSATIDGVTYTYIYTGYGTRIAAWTDDNGEEQEEEQRIEFPYQVGDLLVAVEIQKNADVDGMSVTDEDGTRLTWIDLNASGRHWASPVDEVTSPAVIQFEITSGNGPSVLATVQNSGCGQSVGGTVTVYDGIGCFFDETAAALVGRKGYAIRMKSGDECRYECISLCCP